MQKRQRAAQAPDFCEVLSENQGKGCFSIGGEDGDRGHRGESGGAARGWGASELLADI